MTKHYNGSYIGAKEWAENQNIEYQKIISEAEFWEHLKNNQLDNLPVYFYKGTRYFETPRSSI
jgi:hypothetical protein